MDLGNPISPIQPVLRAYTFATLPPATDFPLGFLVIVIDNNPGIYGNNGTAWVPVGADVTVLDAGTNAVVVCSTIGHNTTGVAANGFGAGLLFTLESTTTQNREAALIAADWEAAADATRDASLVFSVYDHAGAYECLRMDGVGSVPRLGFFGHAAAVRPAAYTLTNVTEDRVMDCNAAADLEICDVLATVINDLIALGLFTA